MDEYAPGGLVPSAPTMAELSARVVFVPLGYGPAVAARAARLTLPGDTDAYLADATAAVGHGRQERRNV